MTDYSPEFEKFLAREAISRARIDVNVIYIDMANGDHTAGIFLSQLVYWYLIPGRDGRSKLRVRRDGEMWVAKSKDEWYDEIRLRPRQFDRVTEMLEDDLGIIETRPFKFAGVRKLHTRIIVDKFLELWDSYAQVDTSELPHGTKTSTHDEPDPMTPNGVLHIQRLLKDKEKDLVIEDDDAETFCKKCGRTDHHAIKLDKDVDPQERCAWCFVLDGWAHHIGKKVPKRIGTTVSTKLRKKATARMEQKEFRDNWIFALERASKMKYLTGPDGQAWFTLEFLLRNDEHVTKIIGEDGGAGLYDNFERQLYPNNHNDLQVWLKWKRSGATQGEPTGAVWSPIGG